MKLTIDPQEAHHFDAKSFLEYLNKEIRKSETEIYHDAFFVIFEGKWQITPHLMWLIKMGTDNESDTNYPGWNYYARMSARKFETANWFMGLSQEFNSEDDLVIIKQDTIDLISSSVIGVHNPHREKTIELLLDKRLEFLEKIKNIELNVPKYLDWVEPPIAIYGDHIKFVRGSFGSTFCQINKEFALVADFEARIIHRSATLQEAKEIIEEYLS